MSELLPNEEVISDGKLSLNYVYNSFTNDVNNYKDKNYYVIVDTREAATTYDDFTFTMKNDYGDEKTYDEYLALDEETQEGYAAVILRSGVELDTVAHISLYEAYFDGLETQNESYNELKSKKTNISELEYANSLYILYAQNYYPEDVYTCDSYGGVPTIRAYNLSLIYGLQNNENYLFLYEEGMECNFNVGKISINFYGDFSTIESLDLSTNKTNKIDSLVFEVYKGSTSLRITIYIFFAFFIWLIFDFALVGAILIIRAVLALRRKKEKHYILKIMNLISSFLPFACLTIGLIGILLGFIVSKDTILLFVPIAIFLTIIVRGVIYYLIEKQPSDYIKEE